ncbi:MAG TPA: LysR substrate-binding domain-containing protein, partial [Polyangiaceae bacterium]|nr:LysR substrate-binding domain-containing protein [Polyangiaceae bacterium]
LVDDEGSFEPARARRTFTLHGVDAVELVLLPWLAKHVAEVAPGLHLKFLPAVPSVFGELESGSLDLAIGVLPAPPAKAFRHQLLYRQRFLCVVRRGHPLDPSSLTLERYLSLSHVGVSPFGHPGNLIDEALAKLGHRREVAVVVPHFLVAPLVVAETDYVALLPEGTARQFADMLSLRLFEPPFAIEPLAVSLLWHERAQFDPAHAWLRETAVTVSRSLR